MSTKVELDNEKLKDITGNHNYYICPENLEGYKKRIIGMIKNEIMFCTVVTGYRGTGKTAFVESIVRELPKNVIPITINATKYKEYNVFIKRFIREIYLRYKGIKPDYLEHLFLHTFFEVKDSEYHVFQNNNNYEKEDTESTKRKTVKEFAANNFVKWMIEVLLTLLPVVSGKILKLKFGSEIISILLLVSFIVYNILSFYQINHSSINESGAEKKEKETKEEEHKRDVVIETLYDDEIAEYQLFNALEKSKEEGKSLLFILDEVDKIPDEELLKLFNDLKPVLLSQHCNVIVVAGKNMNRLMFKRNEEDSIIGNMFSQEVYVPLSSTSENTQFINKLLKDKKEIENVNYQNWVKQIIVESWGNKRKLINLVLSKVEWENKHAYLMIDENEINHTYEKMYNVISSMEEHIFLTYEEVEADEMIYRVYRWLDRIEDYRNEILSTELIINSEDKEVADEYKSDCDQLLFLMSEEHLIKKNNAGYVWDFSSNAMSSIKDNTNYDVISGSVTRIKEVENLLVSFGKYNDSNINNFNEALNYFYINGVLRENQYLKFFREVLPKTVKMDKDDLDYLSSNDCMQKTKQFYRYKPMMVEKMLEWTLCMKTGFDKRDDDNILNHVGRFENIGAKFDIILDDSESNKKLVVETKYYRNYSSSISSKILETISKMQMSESLNSQESSIIYVIVLFIDQKSEKIQEMLKNQFQSLIKSILIENIRINCVTINEEFSRDMDHLIKEIRES